MTLIKAAALQYAPKLGDTGFNLQKAEQLLSGDIDATLIVLPELAGSGYNFENREMALECSEPVPDGPFSSMICRVAQEKKQWIVAGLNERDGDYLYNSAIIAGPCGFAGKYRKVHLFWNEFDLFQPGDSGFPVFNMDGITLGVLICFDWAFPEAWRSLALKGAQVVAHPSNIVLPHAWKALPGHALCNNFAIVTANRTGTERGITFAGKSSIIDARGEFCEIAEPADEAIVCCEVKAGDDQMKSLTPRNHLLKDRRPEFYP